MSPHSDAYLRANRARRRAEQAAAEAKVIHSRVYFPGPDGEDEPPLSAVLYDRHGAAWVTDSGRRNGWRLADGPRDFALKWSSPAMREAGPFVGPRKYDPDVLAEKRRTAALNRWHPERVVDPLAPDATRRGPLRDPDTKTGRRALTPRA